MAKPGSLKEILQPKEKLEGKEDMLEKGDFKALMIASFSVFGPVLIGMLIFFALIILVINFIWL